MKVLTPEKSSGTPLVFAPPPAASAMVGRAWRGYVPGTARNPASLTPSPAQRHWAIGSDSASALARSRSSMHTITEARV